MKRPGGSITPTSGLTQGPLGGSATGARCARCGSEKKLRWGGTFVEIAPGVHRVRRVLWCAICWGDGDEPARAYNLHGKAA